MICEARTFYPFKAELVRCQIYLLIHEALKTPHVALPVAKGHQVSVTSMYVELLERRFPIHGQIIFWN